MFEFFIAGLVIYLLAQSVHT